MAVSARTFQILYVIRQRALEDLPTKFDDFGDFFSARRKQAPDIYGRAYIAPSALTPLLQRMTTGDNLLTLAEDGEYEFTPQGSQMADLLDGYDACSVHFIDDYKAKVCLAVLKQRQRLGQGPINPREAAALANISLDSARRGMTSLVEDGLAIEDRTERTPVYSAKLSAAAHAEIDDLVDDLIEDHKPAVSEEEIEKAARIPLDEDDPIALALGEIDEDDTDWATRATVEQPEEDDEADILPLPLGKILQDDGPDAEPPVNWPTSDPFEFAPKGVEFQQAEEGEQAEVEDAEEAAGFYDWNDVPVEIQKAFAARAKACGMTLNLFLAALNHRQESQVRAVLVG